MSMALAVRSTHFCHERSIWFTNANDNRCYRRKIVHLDTTLPVRALYCGRKSRVSHFIEPNKRFLWSQLRCMNCDNSTENNLPKYVIHIIPKVAVLFLTGFHLSFICCILHYLVSIKSNEIVAFIVPYIPKVLNDWSRQQLIQVASMVAVLLVAIPSAGAVDALKTCACLLRECRYAI